MVSESMGMVWEIRPAEEREWFRYLLYRETKLRQEGAIFVLGRKGMGGYERVVKFYNSCFSLFGGCVWV